MGITERKQRLKEDLKERILQAAKALFVEKGFDATSMRNIAERVEISPTTIYLYYKDKNDIVYALHGEGFKLLGHQFKKLAGIAHPFERFKAMAGIYIQFALDHSDFYELMFVRKGPMDYVQENCINDNWAEGVKTYKLLHEIVAECQQVGYFSKAEPHTFSLMTWSVLHGMCMLKLHKHLDCLNANGELFVNDDINKPENILQSFLNLIEKH
jgi:AcrR family transcriptional regulator